MAKDRRFVGPFKDNHQLQDAYCDKIAMGLTPAQARKDLELAPTTINEALNPNSPTFLPISLGDCSIRYSASVRRSSPRRL